MEKSIQAELEEKKITNIKYEEIMIKHYPSEERDIQNETNEIENRLEEYYEKKLEFLTSVSQMAEEISLDSPMETQEKFAFTPKTIQASTIGITKSEIDLVISQIRSMQIEKNRKMEGR